MAWLRHIEVFDLEKYSALYELITGQLAYGAVRLLSSLLKTRWETAKMIKKMEEKLTEVEQQRQGKERIEDGS